MRNNYKFIFKIILPLVFVTVSVVVYYFIIRPQSLSEKASIPPLYPSLEWNLIKKENLIYPADFSQGNLSLYSNTYKAVSSNLYIQTDILDYYRKELKQRGWYEFGEGYYKNKETVGYFGKLPFLNVYSKFAYYPKQRRFLRIQVSHNELTGNYEYIIEYNTQIRLGS